jgi:hypothetical protein
MTPLTRMLVSLCAFSVAAFAQHPLPPSLSKSFVSSTIPVGGSTNLDFSITNPNAGITLSGIAFTDTLPAGLAYAFPGNYGFCGGSVVLTATTFTLTGGSLAGGASCSGGVTVNGVTSGVKNNVTSTITATGTSAGAAATATLTVASAANMAPTISKAFGVTALIPNGTTSLTFTIANPNATVSLTGVAFNDTLPAGLLVSNPTGLTGSCGGTIAAVPGANTISLTGATLAAGASCTFSVNVTATRVESGLLTNTTSTVTSNQSPAGTPASATIFVGSPYQISYASNLAVGDSYVNMTNTGANGGVSFQSGSSASVPGSLCANIYVFTPDEELLECCSCPITPNGLGSLSAQRDLIANPFTRTVPTSIVIKLLATAPVGGTCVNSASAISTASLSAGLAAWNTTLHAGALTETPFIADNLSASELGRLSYACGAIAAQGSGFGVCNACRVGGLGATAQ